MNERTPATIVVVQRERFALTRRSLDSLYQYTPTPLDLIYVDAGSPRHVARHLATESKRRGFQLIRYPHYLPPHKARNIGAARAGGRYVIFIDNDVMVSPGWLEGLVTCADATGADVVTPLICIGEPVHTTVHVAGGTARIVERDGKRRFEEVQRYEGRPLAKVTATLVRQPTELAEFHCLLARRAFLERIGPMDEGYLATSEHLDFSLTVRQNGGSIYFEPTAVITYLPPPPFDWSDIPYYTLRWCDEWAEASERHFHRKWDIEYDDHVVRFAGMHRRLALRRLRRAARLLLGRQFASRFSDWLDHALITWARRPEGLRSTELRKG